MIEKDLIEKNKQKLLAEQKRLGQLLARVAKKDDASGNFETTYPEIGNTDDDNAAEVVEFEKNMAEERDLVEKLERIDGALARIANGKYGVCQVGGEDIPVNRLEALPEAENCITHEK